MNLIFVDLIMKAKRFKCILVFSLLIIAGKEEVFSQKNYPDNIVHVLDSFTRKVAYNNMDSISTIAVHSMSRDTFLCRIKGIPFIYKDKEFNETYKHDIKSTDCSGKFRFIDKVDSGIAVVFTPYKYNNNNSGYLVDMICFDNDAPRRIYYLELDELELKVSRYILLTFIEN